MENIRAAQTKARFLTAAFAFLFCLALCRDTCRASLREAPDGYTPVRTADDLYGIRNKPESDYMLMNDIDLSQTKAGGELDFGNGWKPIEEFYGTLDGNGYRILNMTIYGAAGKDDAFGFINCLKGKGTVKNLGLLNMSIEITGESDGLKIGGIAAQSDRTPSWMPEITNCFVTGTITSTKGSIDCAGGIAGYSDSLTVTDCYTDVIIDTKGGAYAGGIAGRSGYLDGYGDIKRCYAAGSISGSYEHLSMIGGSDCRDCYYSSDSGKDSRAEGLSEAQMAKKVCFRGFDFDKTWYLDQAAGYSYPQLRSCPQEKIKSCEIAALPEKTAFRLDEIEKNSLDVSGGMLALTYENGYQTQTPLLPDMITEIREEGEPDKRTVCVSYVNAETAFEITVNVPAAKLKLSDSRLTLKKGSKKQIKAVLTPADSTDSITWTSSSPKTASVNSKGIVTAKKQGRAVITARTESGIFKKVQVTVKNP